ncbi:hypothetical protein MMC16_001491 [Acarospora aff. strigata]|nr:hypothetical protein [Acarospora aff. strigata]
MEIIDPRLRSSGDLSLLATTQPPSSSFSTNPIRLPPPHQQHPLLSSNPPPSRHDGRSGHPYYALPDGPHSHRPPSHPDAHHQQGTAAAINDNEESLNDLKRPRACEPCRGLKVRCEPDANNPTGACRRCAKAGRQCIITFPSRKRQKKTDSRVAELEKRIDALTASLQATKRDGVVDLQDRSGGTSPDGGFALHGEENGESTLPTSSLPALQSGWSDTNQQPRRSEENSRTTGPRSQPQEYLGRRLSMPSYTLAGQKRRRSEDTGLVLDSTSTRDQMSCTMTVSTNGRPSDGHVFLAPTNTSSTYKPPVASAASGWPSNHVSGLEYTDVIDRKILEAGTAAQIFDHYVRDMAPHLPAVVFSPQMTAAEIRRTKPTLFLAILSVASGLSHPEVQRTLGKELMRTYADRIIVRGEKSLEIIQALQVSVLWYWPPEHYEELKFYQLVHIAAVMALDLGLGSSVEEDASPRFKKYGKS